MYFYVEHVDKDSIFQFIFLEVSFQLFWHENVLFYIKKAFFSLFNQMQHVPYTIL